MAEISEETPIYYYTVFTLSDDLFYTVDTLIDGVNVIMTFGYNSRLGKRWISIESVNGTVLLDRTFLDIGREIKLNINADLLGICKATLMLFPVVTDVAGSILEWSKNYRISILGMYSEFVDDFDRKQITDRVKWGN